MSLGAADSSSVKTDKQELSHDQNTACEPDTKTTRLSQYSCTVVGYLYVV